MICIQIVQSHFLVFAHVGKALTLQTYRRCVILYHRLSQGSCKIIIL